MLLPLLAATSALLSAPATGRQHPSGQQHRPPDGDQLVRIATPSEQERDALDALGLDLWTEHAGPFVDARVPATRAAWLDASGLAYDVLVPDLGPAVREEHARLAAHGPYHGGGTQDFFADFQPLASVEVRLGELGELGGASATPRVLGTSFEGRAIRSLEISEADEDAPVVLINAGQHAREWISVASAMCVADRLVTQASTDRVSALLSELRFAIVPVVNPDGYEFSWTQERLWRKNRRPPHGVDTNRNFAVAWGGTGSSGNPEAGNYRGEAPFSEPETQALRDYVASFERLAGHVDVHAYGQLVLYPWGFQEVQPKALDEVASAAQAYEDGLRSPYDTDYVAIPGAALYPAAGNAMDWSFGELGSFSIGVELRPDGDQKPADGFVLPPEQILPVCDEVWEATLNFAEFVAAQQPPGPGDDGRASAGPTTGSAADTGDEETVSPPDPTGSSDADAGTAADASASETSSGTMGPAGTSAPASDGTSGAAASGDDNSGCACQTSTRAPGWGWWLLGLFGLGLRRRVARLSA